MKDRQFMVMLGLVVSAGLVLGLIMSRVTAGGGATVVAPVANAAAANPNAPRPSAADEAPDQPAETTQPAAEIESANGEPTVPAKDAPEMQGPANGDPPVTAAVEPPPPSAPAASADTPPQ